METMYSRIITKLIELNYIQFVSGKELIDAVYLIANIYEMKEDIDERFGEEVFKKMINSAIKNLTHVLIGSFGYERMEKQFIEWFNDTYMDQ